MNTTITHVVNTNFVKDTYKQLEHNDKLQIQTHADISDTKCTKKSFTREG